MPVEIVNSDDPQFKPSVIMLVYGPGGVGKTTFASTAPKPILADCENGAKYFALRGIKGVKIARIQTWMDFYELVQQVKDSPDYETIIIDPIGELMEKLQRHMLNKKESKLVQPDGSPTMAGWGWMKTTMRTTLKILRDTGKHVIIIAHVQEKDDDGKIVKRPMVATKLSEEMVNMVDIVGYMRSMKDPEGEGTKRLIMVEPDSESFVAKDRSGQLGNIIPPDFKLIIEAVTGAGKFEWMKPAATTLPKNEVPLEPEKPKKARKKKDDEPPAPDVPVEPEQPAPTPPPAPVAEQAPGLTQEQKDAENINARTRARLILTDEESQRIVEVAHLAGVSEEQYNDGYPDTFVKATKLYGLVMRALAGTSSKGGTQTTIPTK